MGKPWHSSCYVLRSHADFGVTHVEVVTQSPHERMAIMALISGQEAYRKLVKVRFVAWCRMAYGTRYNCGYDDGGLNCDHVTRSDATVMAAAWVSRSAKGCTYKVIHSATSPRVWDFIAKDGQGSVLNYHITVH